MSLENVMLSEKKLDIKGHILNDSIYIKKNPPTLLLGM